mmetsp:Transcript_14892/g.58387  ORF Transcript_14892/g.58387 Transcript_14892/m.58387 type:complete len:204 (-) Transcript_14892:352-963(-)
MVHGSGGAVPLPGPRREGFVRRHRGRRRRRVGRRVFGHSCGHSGHSRVVFDDRGDARGLDGARGRRDAFGVARAGRVPDRQQHGGGVRVARREKRRARRGDDAAGGEDDRSRRGGGVHLHGESAARGVGGARRDGAGVERARSFGRRRGRRGARRRERRRREEIGVPLRRDWAHRVAGQRAGGRDADRVRRREQHRDVLRLQR